MLKGVIFDKDGVLVDTEILITKAADETLKFFGSKKDYTFEQRAQHGGWPAHKTFSIIKEQYKIDEDVDTIVNEYRKRYSALLTDPKSLIVDGVLDFLQELKSNNIKIGVGTGSSLASTKLTLDDSVRQLCDAVVTSDEVKNPKPAPDTFLEAAKRMEILPSNIVVVGDSINDAWGARDGGMKFVFRSTDPSFDLGFKPDMIVATIKDLSIEKLKNIFQ